MEHPWVHLWKLKLAVEAEGVRGKAPISEKRAKVSLLEVEWC